jgi:hypothetical protein
MGMFDYLTCKSPLPLPEYQESAFQTKDTPAQYLDKYEIREDGTLWHQEDRSEYGVNTRWVPVSKFTGEIRFYGPCGGFSAKATGWVEFSAYFVSGTLNQIHVLAHEPKETSDRE